VIASYPIQAKKHRQDQVAKIFRQELAKQLHLLEEPYSPYYKYEPQDVLENNYKPYRDRGLLTDKTIHFNGPDMTLVDKTNKDSALIGIEIPLTHNLQATITEKQRKYQELTFEIEQYWQLNKIIVIPAVLSAKGAIPNMLNQSLTTLYLPPRLLPQVRKVVILKHLFHSDKIPQ
jgi:hypothetical protein